MAESFNSVCPELFWMATKNIASGTRTLPREKQPLPRDGIRKLLTTHLATSSARKLRSSVRREEIMRHDNRANEHRRWYITNNLLLLIIHSTLVLSVKTLS